MRLVFVTGISFRYILADVFDILRKITPVKAWNWVLLEGSYWFSRITGRMLHKGLPVALSIETSALCNLRCPECVIGSGQLARPSGLMEPPLFRSIVDQIEKHTLWLQLHFQGEPFLHPRIAEMIRYASSKGIYTSLSTNGHFLLPGYIDSVLQSGLNRIIISLDGTDQETYEMYRKGGEFLKVTAGIENLAKTRREKHLRRPLIVVQFLVFQHNQHQTGSAVALARKLGADRIQFKKAQLLDPGQPRNVFPADGKWSRYRLTRTGYVLKPRDPVLCHRMWSQPVISWDGQVLPCCFDKQAVHPLGSLTNDTFDEVWRGQGTRNFRQKAFLNPDSFDICRNCYTKKEAD